MKWLWIIAATYLVFVLHAGFACEMAIGGCAPHLVLAGLVLMVLRLNGRDGIALAAAWGFLSDCLVEGRLGADVVAFVLAACAVRQLSVRWNLRVAWRAGAISIGLVWGAIVAGTAIRVLADGMLADGMLADGRTLDLGTLAMSAAGSAIYTGVLVAVISLAASLVGRDRTENATALPAVSNRWRMLTE
jgi:rod shape-determining protein MreD